MIAMSTVGFLLYKEIDFDDSYIVYRIVKNILNGHGWVYNVGENHNASTSSLNTILIAMLAFPFGDIQLAGHIITSLAILGAGVIVYWLFQREFHPGISLVAGALLVMQMSSNRTWGIETNLFIFFLLLFILLEMLKKNSWTVLGFVILTRPDGLILMGLKWLREFFMGRELSLKGIATVVVVLSPWILFSVVQFGQLFPATLSQKVWQGYSGYWGTGFVYAKGFFEHYIVTASNLMRFMLVLALIGTYLIIRARSYWAYLIVFVLIQQLAYVILNVPAYHWYYAIADVAMLIAAFYTCGQTLNWIGEVYFSAQYKNSSFISISYSMSALIIVATAIYLLQNDEKTPTPDHRTYSYISAIEDINRTYLDGKLGTVEVGYIGYHTHKNIVDITGLTSVKGQFVSKDRMDKFYEDPPELLLFHDPIWGTETSISGDYRFPYTYEEARKYENRYNANYSLQLFQRKDTYDLNIAEELVEAYPIFEQVSDFDETTLIALQDGKVFLDRINGYLAKSNKVVEVAKNRELFQIQGWAVDRENQQAPVNIYIFLQHTDGGVYKIKGTRTERLDVAQYLGDMNYKNAGFYAEGVISQLDSGKYQIYIVQDDGLQAFSYKAENEILIP